MDERKEDIIRIVYFTSFSTKRIRIVVSQLHNAIQHPSETDFGFKIEIDFSR